MYNIYGIRNDYKADKIMLNENGWQLDPKHKKIIAVMLNLCRNRMNDYPGKRQFNNMTN